MIKYYLPHPLYPPLLNRRGGGNKKERRSLSWTLRIQFNVGCLRGAAAPLYKILTPKRGYFSIFTSNLGAYKRASRCLIAVLLSLLMPSAINVSKSDVFAFFTSIDRVPIVMLVP